jgi:hypothetical protein
MSQGLAQSRFVQPGGRIPQAEGGPVTRILLIEDGDATRLTRSSQAPPVHLTASHGTRGVATTLPERSALKFLENFQGILA